MENKFLFFVVFAIVTQNSVLLSSAIFNGFTTEGYELLELLESLDYAARNKSIVGFGSFANLLKNGTGQTSSPHDSPFTDALSIAAESTDIIYFAALSVSQKDCNEFEAALSETQTQLKEAIEALVRSAALAQGGNYDENRSEIEHNWKLTLARLVSAYQTLFDLIRSCLNDSSDEYATLIREVQKKVNENYGVITNALYEQIEAYSILTSDCTEEDAAAALASIDRNFVVTIATVIDNIELVFSLCETSYVVTYLNGTDIAHGVFYIRLGRKKTADKLEESIQAVFVAIIRRLLADDDHHEIERNDSTDPTQAMAVSALQAAADHFLETILLTLPNSTDLVTVDKAAMPPVIQEIISYFYDAIYAAEAGSSHNVAVLAIKSFQEIQFLMIEFVIENWFEIIGSDADTEERLAKSQDRVITFLREVSVAVFDPIVILSETAHTTDGASQEDLNKVQTDRLTAIAAVRDAVQNQLFAVLYKYLVEKGY